MCYFEIIFYFILKIYLFIIPIGYQILKKSKDHTCMIYSMWYLYLFVPLRLGSNAVLHPAFTQSWSILLQGSGHRPAYWSPLWLLCDQHDWSCARPDVPWDIVTLWPLPLHLLYLPWHGRGPPSRLEYWVMIVLLFIN